MNLNKYIEKAREDAQELVEFVHRAEIADIVEEAVRKALTAYRDDVVARLRNSTSGTAVIDPETQNEEHVWFITYEDYDKLIKELTE